MFYLNLEVLNFRNIEKLKIKFGPRLNFFLGNNGQGKTNILEALYLVSQGHSFRPSTLQTLIRQGSDDSIIRSHVHTDSSNNDRDYLIQLIMNKESRSVSINGKTSSYSSLRRIINCVIFSPESLSVIKSSPDERRNLIDDLVTSSNPRIHKIYLDFKKTLKTRNRVLRNYQENLASRKQVIDLLDSLDSTFMKLCITITEQRILAIQSILLDFNTAMRNISKSADVDISVEYEVSGRNLINSDLHEISSTLSTRAVELRAAELSSGTSLVGPQKHEIKFLYNQKDSRFFCSQGQQRAIILSFKMAQIVYHRKIHGEYPVLMLDDVLSELDSRKRDSLIQFLHEIKTQIFITSTDIHLSESFKLEESTVAEIERGKIVKLKQ